VRANCRRIRHILTDGLLVLFVVVFALDPGVAFAASPSVIDTNSPALGRSAWTYSDLRDSTAKYEGGYARFDDTSTAMYASSPHGGYATTGSRCQTCHAVHRAEASYQLLRSDTQADVCAYCHLGSAHSSLIVYDGNPDGMATTVGHTIGAPSRIPLSSTNVSLVSASFVITDSAGVATTETITVRSVDTTQNALFRLSTSHGETMPSAGRDGYGRTGPVPLTCMSCHQVHNAADDIWQPMAYPGHETTLTAGYKLLRKRPSGSIVGPDEQPYDNGTPGFTVSYTEGMRRWKQYTDFDITGLVDATATVKVPETTLTAGVYGPGKTIWDSPAWENSSYFDDGPSGVPTPSVDVRGIDQYALSVWCADCHNLAIGSFEATGPVELGVTVHGAARTHTVPFTGAGNGPAQCYTCHRGDLTPEPTSTASGSNPACERCHYGTGSYANDVVRAGEGGSDFPHSSSSGGADLLGAWSVSATGSVVATTVTEANAAGKVCIRCHVVTGDPHGHDSTLAAGCDSCHTTNLVTEHVTDHALTCATCHDSTDPAVTAAITAGNSACDACHDPDDHPYVESMHTASVSAVAISGTLTDPSGTPWTYYGGATQTYAGQTCGQCHSMNLAVEHTKPSSSVPTAACGACHPSPRDAFTTWDKTCEQAGCHATKHTDMATRHAWSSYGLGWSSCSTPPNGCHYVAGTSDWQPDLAAIHNEAWYFGGEYANLNPYPNGCTLCHTSPAAVPATPTACTNCHPSGHAAAPLP